MNLAIEQEGARFQLSLNYFEIYKESLNNLLGPKNATSNNLKISNNKVLNAPPRPVESPEQIFYYIQQGQTKVQMEATGMNDRSSRSHTILILYYLQ